MAVCSVSLFKAMESILSGALSLVRPSGMLCVQKSGNTLRFVDKHILDLADKRSTQPGESSGLQILKC